GSAQAGGYASDDHQGHPGLVLLLHLLHKAQDIEGLDFAIGVVAVDRVLLVGEDLEDGREFGHDEKFDVAAIEVQKLNVAAVFAQRSGGHHQRAEPGGINVIHSAEI